MSRFWKWFSLEMLFWCSVPIAFLYFAAVDRVVALAVGHFAGLDAHWVEVGAHAATLLVAASLAVAALFWWRRRKGTKPALG